MKILKLIFSKWGLSALLFLAQIAIITLLVIYLYEYVLWFAIASFAISILVFFFLINKPENPEYKIPWLFIIFILPIIGALYYLMFSNTRVRKKDVKFYKDAADRLAPFIQNEEKDLKLYDYMTDEYQGIAKYLKEKAYFGGELKNDIKYYPVGEKMWADMLDALKGAKEFILMEYFIVDPGIMWDSIHEILVQKAKDGVKIHLMYDDVGTLSMLKSGYYKKLRKEGIDAHKFNPFTPIVSGIYNNRDHRKILVVDGKIAFTGGINLGDEYINKNDRLGHWKDTGIRIKGSAVNTLTSIFFINFTIAKKEKIDYEKYINKNPEIYNQEGAIIPFATGPKPLYTEQVGEANFINILNKAKKYFYITTPYLIIDNRLTMALKDAAIRGIDVRIITPHIPDKKLVFAMTRSSYKTLLASGVKIYEYTPGFIHAKMLICDDVISFVGTINLDYRSLTHHFECGAVIYKHDSLKDIKNDFLNIFEISQQITKENYKLSFKAKLANAILAIFRAMF